MSKDDAETPMYLHLRWIGAGDVSMPGYPMADMTLAYADAMHVLRTGLWEVMPHEPKAPDDAPVSPATPAKKRPA